MNPGHTRSARGGQFLAPEGLALQSRVHAPRAVVLGAGSFIGGHLVKGLQKRGVHVIRAVDIKLVDEWYQVSGGVENLTLDLSEKQSCCEMR
jgi:GDP-D-mannose 3',5'-epimerase